VSTTALSGSANSICGDGALAAVAVVLAVVARRELVVERWIR